jgi:uncharacterized cysteine cluster protein YcgN (CxxCxxCC family)
LDKSDSIYQPFWKRKTLHEMTGKEWESLCFKCGICCLHRLHGRKSSEIYFTALACRYLDLQTCLCKIYENRFQIDRKCKKITPDNILKLEWLPKTCGYRTVAENMNFKWWHPLISGCSDTVHQAGISIRNKEIFSGEDMVVGDLLKYMLIKPAKRF